MLLAGIPRTRHLILLSLMTGPCNQQTRHNRSVVDSDVSAVFCRR